MYSIPLTWMGSAMDWSVSHENYLIFIISAIIFIIAYLFLIGALINRYLNNGLFRKAFHLREIRQLLLRFNKWSFLRVIIVVFITQFFAISVFVDIDKGFTFAELTVSILTFFFAPFFFVAAKRLTGLQLRRLLED